MDKATRYKLEEADLHELEVIIDTAGQIMAMRSAEERQEHLGDKKRKVEGRLRGICEAYGVSFSYEIDGEGERLVLPHATIECTGNTITETARELTGYLFLSEWAIGGHNTVGPGTYKRITRHWSRGR